MPFVHLQKKKTLPGKIVLPVLEFSEGGKY